jgi:flagellar hook-associated protein 2
MVGLANDLAAAQFALRNDRLTEQTEKIDRQISAASSIRNSLSTLASALGDRVRAGDLSAQPSVANAGVAAGLEPDRDQRFGHLFARSARAGQRAEPGQPGVRRRHDGRRRGSLTLRFGAASAGSFTEDTAHPPVTIAIKSGATLADVAAAVNAKGAGVTAYVAQTALGAQLVLKGADGAKNGFVVEASETPGEEGLAALAWDPTLGGAPARLLAQAGDASFKLDGLAMTSAKNATGTVAPASR